jgi:hypothetical protein
MGRVKMRMIANVDERNEFRELRIFSGLDPGSTLPSS